MSGDFTVVVATFGERKWQRLAQRRAVPSASDQARVVQVHGPSLHEARNEGLAGVHTEFVVFLDADDELAPGYIDAMAGGSADIRVASVRFVRRFRRTEPFMPQVPGHTHACSGECLRDGNFITIASAGRVSLMREVGGFEAWANGEDWALWSRMWLAGATLERIPAAVSRVYIGRDRGRNHGPPVEFVMAERNRISRAVWGRDLSPPAPRAA